MLAVIGGSGLYNLSDLKVEKEHVLDTPFGVPSDKIIQGQLAKNTILFLSRHGKGHKLLPHEVNYRANIFALKKLGASKVLSVSACGSLKEKIKPGDLALVDQYFDHTRGKREYSFFGRGIAAHVSTANPACPELSKDIIKASKDADINIHTNATYGCVEGPRLGTRAESFFLKDSAKCDVVGMTNIPEVFLAREAQLAYCTLCLVTDYDCWMDDPSQHVTVEKFFEVYSQTVNKAKSVLNSLASLELSKTPEDIAYALKFSVMTADKNISAEQKQWLEVLRA